MTKWCPFVTYLSNDPRMTNSQYIGASEDLGVRRPFISMTPRRNVSPCCTTSDLFSFLSSFFHFFSHFLPSSKTSCGYGECRALATNIFCEKIVVALKLWCFWRLRLLFVLCSAGRISSSEVVISWVDVIEGVLGRTLCSRGTRRRYTSSADLPHTWHSDQAHHQPAWQCLPACHQRYVLWATYRAM